MTKVNTDILRKVLRTMAMDGHTYLTSATSLLEGKEVCLKEIPDSTKCIEYLDIDLSVSASSLEDYLCKISSSIKSALEVHNIKISSISNVDFDYEDRTLDVIYLAPISDYARQQQIKELQTQLEGL